MPGTAFQAVPVFRRQAIKPRRDFPERLVLKYFRFKCQNIEKTIDLYQTLGMNIDYKYTYPPYRNPARGEGDITRTVFALSYNSQGRVGGSNNAQSMQLVFDHEVCRLLKAQDLFHMRYKTSI